MSIRDAHLTKINSSLLEIDRKIDEHEKKIESSKEYLKEIKDLEEKSREIKLEIEPLEKNISDNYSKIYPLELIAFNRSFFSISMFEGFGSTKKPHNLFHWNKYDSDYHIMRSWKSEWDADIVYIPIASGKRDIKNFFKIFSESDLEIYFEIKTNIKKDNFDPNNSYEFNEIEIFKFENFFSDNKKFLISFLLGKRNEQRILILKQHNDMGVTNKFKGSIVKYEWLKDFLNHHKSIEIEKEINFLKELHKQNKALKKTTEKLNAERRNLRKKVISHERYFEKLNQISTEFKNQRKNLEELKEAIYKNKNNNVLYTKAKVGTEICKRCGGDGGVRQGCIPCNGKGFM